MFITMLRLCGDCISVFKLFFGDSAPLPASGLFLSIYNAEASFLLSQVSYLCMMTLVGPSLTPGLSPGLSLSRGSRTFPHFLMQIQESPAIHQLHSVDSNQPNELVWTIRDLHRTLQPRRQVRPALISLGHSLGIWQREFEIVNVFIPMLRSCGSHICRFKSSFDDSAPPPAAALFLRIRRRGIVFIISGQLPMYTDFCGTLTDRCIVPRIVPFNRLGDLACFLAAYPRISRYPPIALCRFKSTQ
jgi:hypothetical protein